MTTTREKVIELKQANIYPAEIARRVGISRERVRQIVEGKPAKEDPEPKVMLTVGDVAHLLGIHINTVRRWSNSGVLKPYCIGPRHDRRFRREDIDNFLERSRGNGHND